MASVANIGSVESRKRLFLGLVGLTVGMALLLAVVAVGVPRLWRLVTFVPFWLGSLGVFQARAKT